MHERPVAIDVCELFALLSFRRYMTRPWGLVMANMALFIGNTKKEACLFDLITYGNIHRDDEVVIISVHGASSPC